MVKRMGGGRRKTRTIFRKKPSQRGKFSMTKYFQIFRKGDKVLLKAEPAVHKGMYFRRFNSRSGIVQGKQGKCYMIRIDDLGKEKNIVVHPIHLQKY